VGKAKVTVKTETEKGPLEFRIEIPDSHPTVQALVNYAVTMARPDASQMQLFPAPADPGTPAPEPSGGCKVEGCGAEAAPGLTYCRRCARAIEEIEAAKRAAEERDDPDAGDHPDPDADPHNTPPPCKTEQCGLPATKRTGFCRKCNKMHANEGGSKTAAGAAAEAGSVCRVVDCEEPVHPTSAGYCWEHRIAGQAADETGCEPPDKSGFVACKADGCIQGAGKFGFCTHHQCATQDCPNVAGPAGLCEKCGKPPRARAKRTKK
jgi:hypothetical protein